MPIASPLFLEILPNMDFPSNGVESMDAGGLTTGQTGTTGAVSGTGSSTPTKPTQLDPSQDVSPGAGSEDGGGEGADEDYAIEPVTSTNKETKQAGGGRFKALKRHAAAGAKATGDRYDAEHPGTSIKRNEWAAAKIIKVDGDTPGGGRRVSDAASTARVARSHWRRGRSEFRGVFTS